jgi:hypothetical protein
MTEVISNIPNRKSAKSISERVTLVIVIIGATLGTIGYMTRRRNMSVANDIKVTRFLDQAWDLMGVKPGRQ